jgi:PTH1 family peptidyl-tRNA hydrolase
MALVRPVANRNGGWLTRLWRFLAGTGPEEQRAPCTRLVAGLGNPGEEYRHTRHNVGFLLVESMARAHGFAMRPFGDDALVGRAVIGAVATQFVQPLSFMNRSGPPVFRLARELGIATQDILVIHDDIDLTFGRIKIKKKGGDGGHRGIRSLVDTFGGGDFNRLRIGVGRPGPNTSVIDHVLGEFPPEEAEALNRLLGRARDAVSTFLTHGVQECMNRFN